MYEGFGEIAIRFYSFGRRPLGVFACSPVVYGPAYSRASSDRLRLGSCAAMQLPGPGAAMQTPGPGAAMQSPGSCAAMQSPGPSAAMQTPGSCAAMQSPGSCAAMQDKIRAVIIQLSHQIARAQSRRENRPGRERPGWGRGRQTACGRKRDHHSVASNDPNAGDCGGMYSSSVSSHAG